MVFDGILISFVVGLIRRGNLRGIAELKLKGGWIFPLLLAIQFVFFIFQNNYSILANSSHYVFMLVYIVGLIFLYFNRNHPGFKWILVGVFLNFIVMALNGGRMPVSEEASAVLDPKYIQALKDGLYGKHELLTNSTKLGFLGDIIPLSDPYPRSQVISIGDVVMNIGIFFFIQHLMVKKKSDTDANLHLKGGETT